MNNLSKLAIGFSALVSVGCDDGGMLNPNTETVKADKAVRVESTGFDLRVYEYTPQTAPEMTCILLAGKSKGGVDCFPKQNP